MAFRKEIRKDPPPTVRSMVSQYGDDWALFCATHPISSPVWNGDKDTAARHDAYVMLRCEKGERDRIDPYDLGSYEPMVRPPIVVEHVYPPIPDRSCDWSAVREGYDGAPDSKCLVGRGPTAQAAINDLLEQEDSRDD